MVALYVLGFNFTKLDIEKSRSLGVVTRDKRLVKEAYGVNETVFWRPAPDDRGRIVRTGYVSDREKVALMSGAIVATMLTMVVVPILYWELRRREVADAPTPEINGENADRGLQRAGPAPHLVVTR